LTRQKLSYLSENARVRAGVSRGAYVLADGPSGVADVVLMATGSEVEIAMQARTDLAVEGVSARVVSCPSLELFAQQSQEYRDLVLPPTVRRVAIEAAHPMSWYRWVGSTGAVVGIETFGASAPYQMLYREYGITAEHLVQVARKVIAA
jgi:transketolase